MAGFIPDSYIKAPLVDSHLHSCSKYIEKLLSIPFTGNVFPVHILGPRKEHGEKKIKLARLIPFLKMRFMQENEEQGNVCAVLSVLHTLAGDSRLRLFTRWWKSKSVYKCLFCGFH